MTLHWPGCYEIFKLSLSQFGIYNWPVFGGWQVSPSISNQTLSRCSLQDPGCGRGFLWGWSLLTGRIVKLISEYKILLQTLWVSRWNSLPPVHLPTTTLHSASKGDHLSWFVNFSWSFPPSLRLVSGEDVCQRVRGMGCSLYLRRNMLCSSLPRGCSTPCCVWG